MSISDEQAQALRELTRLLLSQPNAFVDGVGFRHALQRCLGCDLRRATEVASSLPAHLARHTESAQIDYFAPTLEGMLLADGALEEIVNAIIDYLQQKYTAEGAFLNYSYDSLIPFLRQRGLCAHAGSFGDGLKNLISIAGLSSGFYDRQYWGRPANLEPILLAGTARALIELTPDAKNRPTATRTPHGVAARAAKRQGLEPSGNEGHTAMKTETLTILFMDVSGWSGLEASQIHDYVTKALPSLQKCLTDATFVNTWGDAIVATFSSAKRGTECALAIQAFFERAYPADGVPNGLSCRISLHLGEVILCENPIKGGRDIFGEAVHIAARLEPVTARGYVFCTADVARRLEEVQSSAPRALALGTLRLAKDFGEVEAFVVTPPNAADPRPLPEPEMAQESVEETSTATEEPAADVAKVRLEGWFNKLPVARSGEAIAVAEIAGACRVSKLQVTTLLPDIVRQADGGWTIEQQSAEDVILSYTQRVAQVSKRRRGFGL